MILTHGSDPNQVALSFDDGPNEFHTMVLLEILEKYKAKATFFMLGKWVRERPNIARCVKDAGHEIGNHGFSHAALGQIPGDVAFREIGETLGVLEELGISAKLFRPPYGHHAEQLEPLAESFGMKTVMWSQLSGDWAAKIPEQVFSRVNLDTDKGEIVLLHDGGPDEMGADRSPTVKAVEMILQKWPNKKFVTVSELEQ